MSTQPKNNNRKDPLDLLQGTLDLLILRTLIFGSEHGQGIARAIQQASEQELLVEHGALYPALQRLEESAAGFRAKWKASPQTTGKRVSYTLTATGRRQLVSETDKWQRLSAAMARVLGARTTEQ